MNCQDQRLDRYFHMCRMVIFASWKFLAPVSVKILYSKSITHTKKKITMEFFGGPNYTLREGLFDDFWADFLTFIKLYSKNFNVLVMNFLAHRTEENVIHVSFLENFTLFEIEDCEIFSYFQKSQKNRPCHDGQYLRIYYKKDIHSDQWSKQIIICDSVKFSLNNVNKSIRASNSPNMKILLQHNKFCKYISKKTIVFYILCIKKIFGRGINFINPRLEKYLKKLL